MRGALLVSVLVAGLSSPPVLSCLAEDATVYYAPAQDLETIDVALIDKASDTIDMAAFVLSDGRIIEALGRAARRGVAIRIYIDNGQLRSSIAANAHVREMFSRLAQTPGVAIKVSPAAGDLMHLKGYALDGRALRSGSANFSVSGERYQDNDLVYLPSPRAAEAFERNFENLWARAGNEDPRSAAGIQWPR